MGEKDRLSDVARLLLNLDPRQVVGLFQAIGITGRRNPETSAERDTNALEARERHLLDEIGALAAGGLPTAG